MAGVVPPEAFLEVLAGSNEPVPGLAAPENVDVKGLWEDI
jgi:hypothetical protein